MTKKRLYLLVAGLILASLALIVIGLGNNSALIWGAGLVLIALAMMLSFTSRWVR
jgi:hypothetical protein